MNRTVQLEGTFKGHMVQLPDHLRANQKLKQVTRIVQTPIKHRYGASTTSLGSQGLVGG